MHHDIYHNILAASEKLTRKRVSPGQVVDK